MVIMASLYQSASNARKVVVGLLIVTVFLFIYDAVNRNRAANSNVPTLPALSLYKNPDLAFQFVPRLNIESIPLSTESNSDYILERTFTGVFPESAYVYKIEEPREKLDTIEKALNVADVLGFPTNCISSADLQLNPDIASQVDKCVYEGEDYVFTSAQGTKTLNFNKTLSKWQMTTQLFNNLDARGLGALLNDPTQYSGAASSILRNLGFSSSAGLSSAYIEYDYANVDSAGNFFEPEVQTNAKYVFIEIYRKFRVADPKTEQELAKETTDELILDNIPGPIDGIVYSDDPARGIISLIGGNDLSELDSELFFMSFTDFEYATRGVTRGIYPIITPAEAWSRIQLGQGFLTYLVPENGNTFEKYPNLNVTRFFGDATRTTLAFYEPKEWTGFVTPIYVFKGRAELQDGRQASFTIFVEALKRAT